MAMSLSVVLGLCGAAMSDSDHKFYTGATDVSTNLPTRES